MPMPLKYFLIILASVLLWLLTAFFSLSVGSTDMTLSESLRAIFNSRESMQSIILLKVRLPRILLGLFVGGALGISGLILQSLFRNPLVEPYTLGISGGASFLVCLNMLLGLHYQSVYSSPLFGFAGALSTIFFLYYLGRKKGLLSVNHLLLSGVMISFITSSAIMLIMSVAKMENLSGMVFWIMGSLDEPSQELIICMSLVSLLGFLFSVFFVMDMNAFLLGEEEARHLGVNTEKTKTILFFLSSFLTGTSVAVAGVIGFVGLMIPHVLKLFLGSDHRILLPLTFLFGGIFLTLSDDLARTLISPLELPVGVITGLAGGILFLILFYRKKA